MAYLQRPHLWPPYRALQRRMDLLRRTIPLTTPALKLGPAPTAMRDIFEDIFANQPLDPTESARRNMRPNLRARFYQDGHGRRGRAGRLSGAARRPRRCARPRASRSPRRSSRSREAIAAEWNAQEKVVDPAAMPLTRLANSIIDGVAPAPAPVADEIENYLGTDMLFYRAPEPDGLVALQRRALGPGRRMGARRARRALRARRRRDACRAAGARRSQRRAQAISGANDAPGHWRLGALNVVTTLTGSALLALALAARPPVAGRRLDRGACRRGLEHAVLGPRRAGAAAPRLPPQGLRCGGAGAVPRCRSRIESVSTSPRVEVCSCRHS